MSKRWFRFRFSSLLLFVTVACIWLGTRSNEANFQRRVVKRLRDMGGVVAYEHEKRTPRGTVRTRAGAVERILGIDYAYSVTYVRIPKDARGVDKILPDVCRLPRLKFLFLGGDVSDSGTSQLADCPNLIFFSSTDTGISDATLKALGCIHSLRHVHLANTGVTNNGLKHLTRLTKLERLVLHDKDITDGAMLHLAQLTSLKQLDIQRCNVTTPGLNHIANLPALEVLDIGRVNIDQAAVESIKNLRKLKWLGLTQTQVSEVSIQELKAAIPMLQISQLRVVVQAQGESTLD